MMINRFYFSIILRVGAITLTCLLLGYANIRYRDFFINLNFSLLIIVQTYLLIRKLNKTNQHLSLFFDSILYDDPVLVPRNRPAWKSYSSLLISLDRLNKKIQELKLRTAAQEAYFKNLVENMNVGLIGIDERNRIHIFNPAARKILKYTEKEQPLYLNRSFPEIHTAIANHNLVDQKLVKVASGGEVLNLTIRMNAIAYSDQRRRLITLQNIRPELDVKELETWQKTFRVLTHEIMNSISPIHSTIHTITGLMTGEAGNAQGGVHKLSEETMTDVLRGLNIIEERSIGLIEFVDKFRSLTLLPKPQMESITLTDLFRDVGILLRKELSDRKIQFDFNVVPEDLKLMADPGLLRQVMINIVKNSMDALEGRSNPSIFVRAVIHENNKMIEIVDNGKGIPENLSEDVFIPFFSTKENGSGIGLSLSRQIMQLHSGTVTIDSVEGERTTVTLLFPRDPNRPQV